MSLNIALQLVNEGAVGEGRELLNEYIGTDSYRDIAIEMMNNAASDEDGNTFEISNSAWVNDEFTLKSDYNNTILNDYNALVDTFDTNDKADAVERINNYVAEQTHDHITEIVKQDNIKDNTALILVNTLYFESKWKEAWNETESYFNGQKVEMINTRDYTGYYETDEARAFSVPYKNGFEFIGIQLKDENSTLADIDIDNLLKDDIARNYNGVIATMPRIKYETDNDTIVDSMKALGMGLLFSEDAKLDNIVELEPGHSLSIADIIQKCTIELDEYGTVATAATAVLDLDNTMCILDPEDELYMYITLDRDYYYLIRDTETGEIAFMGKVISVDPQYNLPEDTEIPSYDDNAMNGELLIKANGKVYYNGELVKENSTDSIGVEGW